MLSQRGLQTIAIHILPNISRSKNNQAMKFGQSVEYNRNIFLQKSNKMWQRNYFKTFFQRVKMEHIFIQLVFIACKVKGY